jgi:hypothetical protein
MAVIVLPAKVRPQPPLIGNSQEGSGLLIPMLEKLDAAIAAARGAAERLDDALQQDGSLPVDAKALKLREGGACHRAKSGEDT